MTTTASTASLEADKLQKNAATCRTLQGISRMQLRGSVNNHACMDQLLTRSLVVKKMMSERMSSKMLRSHTKDIKDFSKS
jgi:hypothetical protein